jgi:hypothetical protein
MARGRARQTMANQDFGCIRYGGEDPEILKWIADNGRAKLCDVPVEIGPVRRDHVT